MMDLASASRQLTATPSRYARWRRSRHFRPYNRLLVGVILLNIAAAIGLATTQLPPEDVTFTMTGTNIFVAVIIRQQYVVNVLFRLATSVPRTWPLRVRWAAAKVYNFGGIHVGAAISATGWYVAFTISTLVLGGSALVAGGSVVGVLLLLCIVTTALPFLRARFHNLFEVVHRFGGWALLAVVWAQSITRMVEGRHGVAQLVTSIPFWMLVLTTISIVLPWMRLRRVPVDVATPSDHVALATFDYGVTPFAGSSTSLSRNPLREWHSFANVPAPERQGYRLTISRAGDWTGKLIADAPATLWVKGIPTAGVGNIDKLFHKVLWVATGSGIGPCLPHLLARTAPAQLVWSTRTPASTYGEPLVEEILDAVPDAIIWDTSANGKPDLLSLALDAYERSGAEAVICISNQPTTWNIVEGFEMRGIPAFGAIWDS